MESSALTTRPFLQIWNKSNFQNIFYNIANFESLIEKCLKLQMYGLKVFLDTFFSRLAIFELQNRVTQINVTPRVTNSKTFIEIIFFELLTRLYKTLN